MATSDFTAFCKGKQAWHISVAEAAAMPLAEGERSLQALGHGSMLVRYYAPEGRDAQTPHDQDEIYIVIRGHGTFVNGPDRVAFGPGDVLFAPAGRVHRFEDFSDDFATWVVFYGPAGGEAPV